MPRTRLHHAVVTGDIVRSTRLSRAEFQKVQAAITRAGKDLARRFPGRLPFPVELSRGDSWQLFLPDPADGLRMALFVRAFLRSEMAHVDTRVAIGVGAVDKMPERSVGDGRGEAFRLSGDLVDRKGGSRMRFAMGGADTNGHEIAVMLTVLDVVASRWTSAQAIAIRGALLGWTQEQIAAKWPGRAITQQSAGQHLGRAGWEGVHDVLEYYESAMRSKLQ